MEDDASLAAPHLVELENISSPISIVTAQIGPGTRHAIVNVLSVFGINDERASDTIFPTTTGLRAVDATKARSTNPWLTVGSLHPGHVLLRDFEDA